MHKEGNAKVKNTICRIIQKSFEENLENATKIKSNKTYKYI